MVTAPPPGLPGAPPPPFEGNRCLYCGGSLYATQATGRPQPDDHEPHCDFFERAVQVMQYVQELERAAAGSGGRYVRKGIKELISAACAGDPVRAITTLARKYAADAKKGIKEAAAAEMLNQACQALAQGKDPAPISPGGTSTHAPSAGHYGNRE
jgi:hypothetical protein